MHVRIIRSHCLGGGKDAFEGEVLDLPTPEALRKIKKGWAVACDPPAPAAAAHRGVKAKDEK
jgi:hypothetical protein